VYTAESRALVHYLLTDGQTSGIKSLERYIAQVEGGADALEAARQVFGDLNQLQGRLDAYIKQITSPPTEILAGGGSESVSSPHTLTPAETEARIGTCTWPRQRDDARTKFEDALMHDSSLASAEESLGFLELQGAQLEEAEKHFMRAAEIDPKRPLAFYGQGMVAMSRGGSVGVPVGAIVALTRRLSSALNSRPRGLTSPRFTRCARKLSRRLWTPRNTPRLWSQVTPATNTRLPSFSRTWDEPRRPERPLNEFATLRTI